MMIMLRDDDYTQMIDDDNDDGDDNDSADSVNHV